MAMCLVCGAEEHDWEHPAAIRNVSTPEDTAANVIRLRVEMTGGHPEREDLADLRRAFSDELNTQWRSDMLAAGEDPLRWERPRIVSTRGSTAAGTPKPQGWEQ